MNKENGKSEYEARNGLVARKELRKNMMEFLDELSDEQFHGLYSLLWSLSASRTLNSSGKLLLRLEEEKVAELKKKIKESE